MRRIESLTDAELYERAAHLTSVIDARETELQALTASLDIEGQKLTRSAKKLGLNLSGVAIGLAIAMPTGGLSLVGSLASAGATIFDAADLRDGWAERELLKSQLHTLREHAASLAAQLQEIYDILRERRSG